MKMNTLACATIASLSIGVSHAALITTSIGGQGSAVEDNGSWTLSDSTASGDFWEGADEGAYVHEEARITGSFSAVVRVTGQSEAANGRWGKAGIQARDSLLESSFVQTTVNAGNGSQADGANPVPPRLAGVRQSDGLGGGFELGMRETNGGTFNTDGSVTLSWLRLDYDADTQTFRGGIADDIAGSAGEWDFSPLATGVADADPADGWYVGMAYSAHGDMTVGGVEGEHAVTFDNFSITQGVPEPSTTFLGLGALGLLIRRKR